MLAPSNAAIAAMPPSLLWRLKSEDGFLASVLKFHVIRGQFPVTAMAQLKQLPTLQGEVVEVEQDAPRVIRIVQAGEDARITVPDVVASNGIIHVLDKILVPPSLQVMIAWSSKTRVLFHIGCDKLNSCTVQSFTCSDVSLGSAFIGKKCIKSKFNYPSNGNSMVCCSLLC